MSPSEDPDAGHVLEHLRRPPALTLTELAAKVSTSVEALSGTVADLEASGRTVTAVVPSVDRHLPAITVVAAVHGGAGGDGVPGPSTADVAEARHRASTVAASWQRRLLAAHRCC